jgi:hypothetical protein
MQSKATVKHVYTNSLCIEARVRCKYALLPVLQLVYTHVCTYNDNDIFTWHYANQAEHCHCVCMHSMYYSYMTNNTVVTFSYGAQMNYYCMHFYHIHKVLCLQYVYCLPCMCYVLFNFLPWCSWSILWYIFSKVGGGTPGYPRPPQGVYVL